MNVVFEDC